MEKERENLLKNIASTFQQLVLEVSNFDRATLNARPFEGSWTAGQTTKHILICGGGIPDSHTSPVDRPYDEQIEALKGLFLNSELKFEANPALVPHKGPYYKEALLQNINKISHFLEHLARTADLTALCLDMELPTFGYLTRYEWLYFILFHTQRHTNQIITIGKHLKST